MCAGGVDELKLVVLIIKFLQSLIKALNSDGTPGQVAMGIALGLVFGLSPLTSPHNLVVLVAAMLTTVSIPGVMLGWVIAVPLGFVLDPLFHKVGLALLTNSSLEPLWVWIANTPVISLARLNNTIVLGSLVVWLVLLVPAYFGFRILVVRYRAHVLERLAATPLFKMVKGSRLWNLYQLLRP